MRLGKIICVGLLSLSMVLGTLNYPTVAQNGEPKVPAEPTVFSADFTSLRDGAVSKSDTETVNALQSKFTFFHEQEGYYFERPKVNGYLCYDNGLDTYDVGQSHSGVNYRMPDTGLNSNFTNFDGANNDWGYPVWTVDGKWLYLKAHPCNYSFRHSGIIYPASASSSTGLATLENFTLEMDFKFRAYDENHVQFMESDCDSLAIFARQWYAGSIRDNSQSLFNINFNGTADVGTGWGLNSGSVQMVDGNGNNTAFVRGTEYHLTLTAVGTAVNYTVKASDGTVAATGSFTAPTTGQGYLGIGGSNEGVAMANIEITRLDSDGNAVDFYDENNGWSVGFNAGTLMRYRFINGNRDGNYSERMYLKNPEGSIWTYTLSSTQGLYSFNDEPIDAEQEYVDAVNKIFNFYYDYYYGSAFAKMDNVFKSTANYDSVGTNIKTQIQGGSNLFFKYASRCCAEWVYSNMISMSPKAADGSDVLLTNFELEFSPRLYWSEDAADGVSLSFRSAEAGRNSGYGDKVTLVVGQKGFALYDNELPATRPFDSGNYIPWNGGNCTSPTIKVKVVGNTISLYANSGSTVLYDGTFELKEGTDTGYLYFSAANNDCALGTFAVKRLDSEGNPDEWDNPNALGKLYYNSQLLPIGHADVVNGLLQMDWTNSGFEISGNISGALKLETVRTDNDSFVNVIIDGGEPAKITVPVGTNTITVADNLAEGEHTVRVLSGTSPSFGTLTVTDIIYSGELNQIETDNSKIRMMAIGDSITAGFGINGKNGDSTDTANKIATSDGYNSYAAIAARMLGAEIDTVAKEAAPISEVHGLANKLNMRAGSPEWNWGKNQKDIIVINLGTNDEWIPGKTAQTALEDAKALLDDMRTKNPDAYIIWVYGMMRKDYEASYKAAVEYMNAKGDTRVFSLEMQPNTDALEGHPSAAAHAEYANQLVTFIRQNCSEIINASTQTKTLKELNNQGVIAFNGRSKWDGNAVSSVYGSAGFTVSGYIYGDFVLNCSHSSDNIVRLDIILDGDADNMQTIELPAGFSGDVTLIEKLTRGKHTVQVRRASSDWGTTTYNSITYTGTLGEPETKALRMEFIGDSITVGEGAYGWFNNSDGRNYVRYQNSMTGYAAQTAKLLDTDFSMLAHCGATTEGMLGVYNNANSDYTNDAGRKDIVVINLGTNDVGWRNESDLSEEYIAELRLTVKNMIQAVIDKNGKDVCIVWCYGMMFDNCLSMIEQAVNETAPEGSNVFFCDLSAAKDNGGYGEHPSLAGHTAAAEILSEFINSKCMHIVANGDVNLDTFTDIRDLVRFKKYFSGIEVAFAKQKADVNLDKVLDSADIVKLRKLLLGIE